jgi:hypothetical protein
MDILDILTSRRNEITLAVLIVSVLTGSGMYAYTQMNIESQSVTYPANGTIVEPQGENFTLGIDAGNELNFGRVSQGANVTKTIEIAAGNDTLTFIEVASEGNISDYLEFDERNLFYNSTGLELELKGSSPGYYEGNVSLDIKTAQNWWGEKWLEQLYRSPF